MKDSWLRAAISDDTLVAAFLLRLKHSPPPLSSTSSSSMLPSWGLRLPRSKQPPPPSTTTITTATTTTSSTMLEDSNYRSNNKRRKSKETTTHGRLSPTTPLSWAGATSSPSDDSHSSLHVSPPSDPFRSKVSASFQTPSTATNKRPRKKKTFAVLKEEESSLLKERIYLKKELDTLRLKVNEQRSLNENLKRVKLDHVETRINSDANSVDERINKMGNAISEATSSSVTRVVDKIDDACEPDSQKQHVTSQEQLFMLPDLNMAPEDTVGMS